MALCHPGADRLSPLLGAGTLLRLIRDGEAMTRAELARHTGLSRSTVAQRVDALLAHALVYEAGGSASTGGRPPTVLAFNELAGVVLAADLGATHSRLAVTDLAGDAARRGGARPRHRRRARRRCSAGSTSASRELLAEAGRTARSPRHRRRRPGTRRVRDRPAGQPADHARLGRLPVPDWFASRYGVPVLVDNDVNIMALGEHWSHWRDTEHFLFVKVGTGIGCGHRGRRQHPPRRPGRGRRHRPHPRDRRRATCCCRCGNVSCLEAVAGGRALARQLAAAGRDAANSRDVVALVRAGEPQAVRWCARPAARSARCWPPA